MIPERFLWPTTLACFVLLGILVVLGIRTGLPENAGKQTPGRWYLVERTTTPGDKIDLSCVQWVNRLDLASRASVPLKLGDRVKTICTVVPKPIKEKA